MITQRLSSTLVSGACQAADPATASPETFLEVLVAELKRICTFHAVKHGFRREDFQDCVAGFRVELLSYYFTPRGRDVLTALSHTQRSGFLHRCAHHYVSRFAHRAQARCRCHRPWPYDAFEAGRDFVDTEPTPEQQVVEAAFWQHIDALLLRLPPPTRRLLIAHYRHGEPLAEVAVVEGLSVPEVSRRLYRGLRSLRRNLMDQGESAATLRQSLHRAMVCHFATEYDRILHFDEPDEK